MSFYEHVEAMNWDDIRLTINAKTASDVIAALSKQKLNLEDFQALISPAAEPFIEQMAQRAYQQTRERFGNTMSFYIPLYLSNLCSNVCTYCGFSMEHHLKRKVLTQDEISAEVDAIKSMKFDSVLLVTGEHERKVGMDYFRNVVPLVKEQISYLAMEVQPLEQHEYEELIELGVDAVMVYQETYHPSTYAQHHLKGKKTDFKYRIETADRLAKAGMNKIGLGALIGLDDWRVDSFFVASHLNYLEKHYWQTRYSVSFPRIRPCEGSIEPKSVMTDKQLVQLICAYRLLNNEVELSLSTRESAYFRDNVLPLGITHISAASKTQPGGYANDEEYLEQFSISDERSAIEVAESVSRLGFTPVWRDWHSAYSGR